jgi:hypothetical protein
LYDCNIKMEGVLLGDLKGNKLQLTAKNCVVLVVCDCVCICGRWMSHNLFASVAGWQWW